MFPVLRHSTTKTYLSNGRKRIRVSAKLGMTALMCAARQGDEEIFDILINHNANVMMKDNVSFI